eukprot:1161124-Pelagomonas_calceolata.AAC.5
MCDGRVADQGHALVHGAGLHLTSALSSTMGRVSHTHTHTQSEDLRCVTAGLLTRYMQWSKVFEAWAILSGSLSLPFHQTQRQLWQSKIHPWLSKPWLIGSRTMHHTSPQLAPPPPLYNPQFCKS